MIPRVLWAYWYGTEEPSWLRSQTIASFERHHPDWEVRLIRDVPGVDQIRPAWWPDDLDGLPPDVRCDLVRWNALEAVGGVFVDFDVIFFRSIEDMLGSGLAVTVDGGTAETTNSSDRAFAIGLVWSTPGSPLAVAVAQRAREIAANGDPIRNHQACGTWLLSRDLRHLEAEVGQEVEASVSAARLYPQGFYRRDHARIWVERDRPLWPLEGLVGLHWGGGHRSSKWGATVDETWARSSTSFVARAWRRAMLTDA